MEFENGPFIIDFSIKNCYFLLLNYQRVLYCVFNGEVKTRETPVVQVKISGPDVYFPEKVCLLVLIHT